MTALFGREKLGELQNAPLVTPVDVNFSNESVVPSLVAAQGTVAPGLVDVMPAVMATIDKTAETARSVGFKTRVRHMGHILVDAVERGRDRLGRSRLARGIGSTGLAIAALASAGGSAYAAEASAPDVSGTVQLVPANEVLGGMHTNLSIGKVTATGGEYNVSYDDVTTGVTPGARYTVEKIYSDQGTIHNETSYPTASGTTLEVDSSITSSEVSGTLKVEVDGPGGDVSDMENWQGTPPKKSTSPKPTPTPTHKKTHTPTASPTPKKTHSAAPKTSASHTAPRQTPPPQQTSETHVTPVSTAASKPRSTPHPKTSGRQTSASASTSTGESPSISAFPSVAPDALPSAGSDFPSAATSGEVDVNNSNSATASTGNTVAAGGGNGTGGGSNNTLLTVPHVAEGLAIVVGGSVLGFGGVALNRARNKRRPTGGSGKPAHA